MVSGEAWLYILSVIINAINLFLQVFFTIMYSDLEWWVGPRLYPSVLSTSCAALVIEKDPYLNLANNSSRAVTISTPSNSAIDSIHTLCRRLHYTHFWPRSFLSTGIGLRFSSTFLWSPSMPRSEISVRRYCRNGVTNSYRIFDNQHLLDATEIFRRLNVHKKVGWTEFWSSNI